MHRPQSTKLCANSKGRHPNREEPIHALTHGYTTHYFNNTLLRNENRETLIITCFQYCEMPRSAERESEWEVVKVWW